MKGRNTVPVAGLRISIEIGHLRTCGQLPLQVYRIPLSKIEILGECPTIKLGSFDIRNPTTNLEKETPYPISRVISNDDFRLVLSKVKL